MKKLIMTILALTISNIANAEYTIKINLENEPIKFTNWQEYESIYGEWTNNNELYGCSNWTPLPNEVTINLEFTQTATDCNQDQTRTVQDQTIDTVSNQVVNDGEPYTESRTITVSDSRQAIGTMETWVSTIPDYTDWINTGGIYGCNTWSPDPSTVTINQSFIQTSNNCKQDQERIRQDREQETTTNEIRNVGPEVTESRTIAASSTRNATGTKETWVATTPNYTDWINDGGIYGCSNWSPAASTVEQGKSFTQTATDCEQNQTRTRQDREQETTTLAYRNVGSLVTETKVLYNQNSYKNAVGTKVNYLYDSNHYVSCDSSYDFGQGLWTRIEIGYGSVYEEILVPQDDRCPSVGQVYNIGGISYTVGPKVYSNAEIFYIKKN